MSFTDANYYKYLQVYEQAEQEVIEAAYRRLAKKYHPDINSSKEAEEKMKLINQAYDILSDHVKRKEYDAWLSSMISRKNPGERYKGRNSERGREYIDIDMEQICASARERYEYWKVCQENDFREEKEKEKKRRRRKRIRVAVIVILVAIGGYVLLDSETSRSQKTMNDVSQNDISQNIDEQEDTAKLRYQVTTKGSMLNVRKEPQPEGELIQKLENGTVCEATGNCSEDGWTEILIPDTTQTGWAKAQYLTPLSEDDPRDDVENSDSEETAENPEMPSTKTMSGKVTLTLQSKSLEEGTVVIRIANNTKKSVRTFGLPTLIVSGESIALDSFSNIHAGQVEIAAGSYSDITYYIDARAFSEDSELDGELWCMNPSEQDRSYRLNIN